MFVLAHEVVERLGTKHAIESFVFGSGLAVGDAWFGVGLWFRGFLLASCHALPDGLAL